MLEQVSYDLDIARQLVSLYAGDAGCDLYEPGDGDHGICWGLTITPGRYLYKLRGSKKLIDWFRDLIAIAAPWQHNVFGPVHSGFLVGMSEAVTEMLAHWDGKTPIALAGHSLGAGRVAIAAAIMISRGVPPGLITRVVFGEPKPGLQKLADYLKLTVGRSYRNTYENGYDFVMAFPATFPSQWYVRPNPFANVSCPPDVNDKSCLDLHHMPLYVKALEAMVAQ